MENGQKLLRKWHNCKMANGGG